MGNNAGLTQNCRMDAGNYCAAEVPEGCKVIMMSDVVDIEEDEGHRTLHELDEAVCLAPVWLNVYHLNEHWLRSNKVSQQILGLGGAFHAGVEVYGTEYTFGSEGVSMNEPKKSDFHVFHESIFMGETAFTPMEVSRVIGELSCTWFGEDYDILDHNCCHFASDLCHDLVGAPLPNWVCNFSRLASAAAATLENTVDVKGMVDLRLEAQAQARV
mmetsp:Transcript_46953/g.77971  ORF Transcript_46953/g.77971 Transcript_46953/m.77971 type:complete len:214 (-) Transcript_46953:143-784(-)